MQKITSSSHCPRDHFAIGCCSLNRDALIEAQCLSLCISCSLLIFINSLLNALFTVCYISDFKKKYYFLIENQLQKKVQRKWKDGYLRNPLTQNGIKICNIHFYASIAYLLVHRL